MIQQIANLLTKNRLSGHIDVAYCTHLEQFGITQILTV